MEKLIQSINSGKKLVVLTGAGISAASGIPTYRNHKGLWRSVKPIQHQEFIESDHHQRRYWLRSALGWPLVANAQPNESHYRLQQLESAGIVTQLITQNVDRLHQRAGQKLVIDLHGRLDRVICLDCKTFEYRSLVQDRLMANNPFINEVATIRTGPDGDAHINEQLVSQLCLPRCQQCNGTLMPDVVFFGGTVAKAVVTSAMNSIAEANVLLVVGSSLTVYSGFRFCRFARELGIPIYVINQGETRADEFLHDSGVGEKISMDCTLGLRQLVEQIEFTPFEDKPLSR